MILCAHCGEDCLISSENIQKLNRELNHFCCRGCEMVYAFLNKKGLGEFYKIRNQASFMKKRAPIGEIPDSYEYYDDENFLKDFLKEDKEGRLFVEFYLEGVHCLACLWLIEKMSESLDGISEARLNLESSRAVFTIEKGFKLSKLVRELHSYGYRPYPIKFDDEHELFSKLEERKTLIRIGVAMACAGNIGLLAISLYAGAVGKLATQFRWISLLFTLPIIFYSAIPFYRNTYYSIKRRVISIDFPVTFAIFVGFLSSLINLTRGRGEVYFDSLSSLVFLLLLSRYILQKVQQKGVSSSELEHFFSYGPAHKLNEQSNKFESIYAKYLVAGDIVRIRPGDIIPADGKVLKGKAYIDVSLLTGESIPQKLSPGDSVYSGTKCTGNEFTFKVEQIGKESRIGQILADVQDGRKKRAHIVTLTDQWAKYFIITVFFSSLIMLFSYSDLSTGVTRAITLIMVTCPCALALATPLAMSSILNKCSNFGFIIRSEVAFEKLANVKDIFLDKTGTLTYGRFQVVSWDSDEKTDGIIYTLEKNSDHPIAMALKEKLGQLDLIPMTDVKEIFGSGVEGKIGEDIFRIGKIDDKISETKKIGLYKNRELIKTIHLRDTMREGVLDSIQKIRNLGKDPYLISGDTKNSVELIAQKLNLSNDHYFHDVSPAKKNEIITNSKEAIMVGDGANDALALTHADVGIAVHGSIDISLKAADIYLTTPGINSIVQLIELSKETLKIVKRNIIFSLSYNLIGAGLTIMGFISPLWAAILMPVSSITVLLSTLRGTSKTREIFRGAA